MPQVRAKATRGNRDIRADAGADSSPLVDTPSDLLGRVGPCHLHKFSRALDAEVWTIRGPVNGG